MGMIEPGNSTEFRRGRIEMTSGTSTGPSGTGFLVAMVRSYTREAYFASQAETGSADDGGGFRSAHDGPRAVLGNDGVLELRLANR